jgi:hypothetical protein
MAFTGFVEEAKVSLTDRVGKKGRGWLLRIPQGCPTRAVGDAANRTLPAARTPLPQLLLDTKLEAVRPLQLEAEECYGGTSAFSIRRK